MTERRLAPLSALSTLTRRPRPEVRVHFFNPNQIVRVSQRTVGAPALRPVTATSRPVIARLIDNPASRSAPRLVASHPASQGVARPQPEIRSGR